MSAEAVLTHLRASPLTEQDRFRLATTAPRVRAVVLLAGSVRPSDLSRGIGRSLLDLPVESGLSVLGLWLAHVEALADAGSVPALPLRIIVNRDAPQPTVPTTGVRVPVTVERDTAEFRGTGGILRDAVSRYAPDDLILVGNGAQILIEPLTVLVAELCAAGGGVGVIAHGDGTPTGLFLIRCSVLAGASDVGFLDFKEQLLPRLAASGHEVCLIQRPRATGCPVRTLDGYLSGLRAYHRVRRGLPVAQDAFDEDWTKTFSIVEPGSNVDPSATVHDSVVLAGARIERNAAVVRCVVCPPSVVRAGETMADRILTGGERAARGPG